MDRVGVALEAVVVAVTDGRPRVLASDVGDLLRLPAGRLDVAGDPSLDLAMRRVIGEQTDLGVEYLEQLYTFGDRNRSRAGAGPEREIGVGYLVLTREAAAVGQWVDVYELFPWEDRRSMHGPDRAPDRLVAWAGHDPARLRVVQICWGLGDTPWDGARALERYEVLYEARLVPEWFVDHEREVGETVVGIPMVGDHRRVVATALSRLRGKLTYRPLVFDLLDEVFTLSDLQRTVEALAGQTLHTQNFRRMVDRAGLVEGVGRFAGTGGRPAELHRFRDEVLTERPRAGVLG